MEIISVEAELSRYNLKAKWNDYIGIQKEVLRVLRKEKFFDDNIVVNKETGMYVVINAKGIRETIGTGKRFQVLPKKLKIYKIATLRHLKTIIENVRIIADDVENRHDEKGCMFAYLCSEVILDGKHIFVRISVKKKVASNWFWIHNIDENKKAPNYSTHQ